MTADHSSKTQQKKKKKTPQKQNNPVLIENLNLDLM
jgi:hypothetical protein